MTDEELKAKGWKRKTFQCSTPAWKHDALKSSLHEREDAEAIESYVSSRVAAAVAEERERCAKVAESTRDGYTANIRVSEDEQEFLKDPDGPWVLNSDIAAAIRAQ